MPLEHITGVEKSTPVVFIGDFMLSGQMIKQERISGNIIIEKFNEDNLQPNSYDITLGKSFVKFNGLNNTRIYIYKWGVGKTKYNIGYIDSGPIEYSELYKMELDHDLIPFMPSETVLCHTEEFFGSVRGSVPKIATKSTMARLGIDICGSAGFGDVGYINRWTLQIRNNSPNPIHLEAGVKIGQVYFEELYGGTLETYSGEYQSHFSSYNYDDMLAVWKPEHMMPKEKHNNG